MINSLIILDGCGRANIQSMVSCVGVELFKVGISNLFVHLLDCTRTISLLFPRSELHSGEELGKIDWSLIFTCESWADPGHHHVQDLPFWLVNGLLNAFEGSFSGSLWSMPYLRAAHVDVSSERSFVISGVTADGADPQATYRSGVSSQLRRPTKEKVVKDLYRLSGQISTTHEDMHWTITNLMRLRGNLFVACSVRTLS